MKVKLKNGLTGTIVDNTSIIFDTHDVCYSHSVPAEDIDYELNGKIIQEIEKLINTNILTVYTKDYGNIDVIDIESLQNILNKYKRIN